MNIGTDIIECDRIAAMLERHGEHFTGHVFTETEMRYCQYRKNAAEHFAGRWAAKEAVLKALGTGWASGISWTDAEIISELSGKPAVVLHGGAADVAARQGIAEIIISISHCKKYAVATAVTLP
jgi:holo-[acyl-carrier protein] synthase